VTDGRLLVTIDSLLEISSHTGGVDGIRVFGELLHRSIVNVDDQIRSGAFFDADFAEQLATRTAQPFLDAVRLAGAGDDVPPAWRPLSAKRRQSGLQPVQFILAGINALLNHDAPVALVQSCNEANLSPYRPEIEQDFHRFCVLLAVFAEPVRAQLTNKSDTGSPSPAALVDVVRHFSLSRARRAAWVNGLTLWQIASIKALAQPFEVNLAHTAGLIGSQLLIGFADQLEVTQPLTDEMLFGR